MSAEAHGVLDEDLESAAAYYDSLLNDTLPQHQAEQMALQQFGVVLDSNLLNRIMAQYACTLLSLEQCVAECLRRAGLI